MTTLILVRHGENEWVKEHRLAGWIEGVHLNERGHQQAAHTAERLAHLPLKAVYSSPVTRCLETADYLAQPHQLTVQHLPAIGEVRYGEWEGEQIKELAKLPLWHVVQHYPSRMEFPGGETMRGVQTRGVDALEALAAQHPQEMIAVCSHADLIKMVLAHYLGTHLDLFQRLVISPASISIVHLGDHGRVFISRLNDTGTIEMPPPPKAQDAPAKDN